jgi:hypothetical protein
VAAVASGGSPERGPRDESPFAVLLTSFAISGFLSFSVFLLFLFFSFFFFLLSCVSPTKGPFDVFPERWEVVLGVEFKRTMEA